MGRVLMVFGLMGIGLALLALLAAHVSRGHDVFPASWDEGDDGFIPPPI